MRYVGTGARHWHSVVESRTRNQTGGVRVASAYGQSEDYNRVRLHAVVLRRAAGQRHTPQDGGVFLMFGRLNDLPVAHAEREGDWPVTKLRTTVTGEPLHVGDEINAR
jgi:hypothetical protein